MKVAQSFFFGLVLSLAVFVHASDKYPTMPDANLTPGAICEDSDVHRYPENIVYCDRDVDTKTKNSIIRQYDEELGFSIRTISRGEFKIDHFIPLSIGGANSRANLWPQHRTVYTVTDPLEHLLFERIKEGRIKQADAIRVIKEAKLNLGRVPELIDYVEGL
jgi:hypothetical protein